MPTKNGQEKGALNSRGVYSLSASALKKPPTGQYAAEQEK
jgi:hypothetical protein